MSVSGEVSAALLNMCAQAQGSVSRNDATVSRLSSSTDLNRGSAAAAEKVAVNRPKEDYEWLQHVMASVESCEKKIARLLGVIEKQSNISFDEYMNAVEELGDLLEDTNWAKEFVLMNGPSRVIALLSGDNCFVKEYPAVTDGLLMVIAQSSQLQDAVQQKFSDAHWEEVVVPLLKSAAANGTTSSLAVALHAVSCLCRSCEKNTITFINCDGLEILANILSQTGQETTPLAEKVLKRVIFFIGSLAEFGVSTEKLIRLVCKKLSLSSTSEAVQCIGAEALLDLSKKSLEKVKGIILTDMQDVLNEWKRLSIEGSIDDSRSELVKLLN